MVTWAGDGLIAGYDPLTKKLKAGLYHFASPGSVDLGGVTRINYPLGAGLNTTTYPNGFQATAPFTFVAGDFTANPGKKLSAALYFADAANFPAGHVPTPSEILALGDSKVTVRRATYYATNAQTHTFVFNDWTGGLPTNSKYWFLILPTALADSNSPWNLSNDVPMSGITVDTFGRALSLYANRTPAKPVITSPVNDFVALIGSEFTLSINPADPDEVSPEDAAKFNSDVCGVQFQYAPMPTVDDPNPVWTNLPYDIQSDFRFEAWHIRGSRYVNGLPGLPTLEALVANLGCTVAVAPAPDDIQEGKGALPAGEWQIRARTFDFGHPYPSDGTSTTAPGPLGINPATTQLNEPAINSYPAANTSPWSDAVHVSVPTQVPVPIPLYPTSNLAIPEGETVRLSWKYRNTHQPPRDQYSRTVQIRKVGDPDWVTIFDGPTDDTFVDLPPVLTQSPVTPVELLSSPGFESGTLDGWSSGDGGTTILTNVNNVALAHSGNRYLQVVTAANGEAQFTRITTPDVEYTEGDVSIWFYADSSQGPSGLYQLFWTDSGGVGIIPDDPFSSTPYYKIGGFGDIDTLNEWVQFVFPTIERPPGGVNLILIMVMDGTVGPIPYTFRFDDASFMVSGADLGDFSLVSRNQYEWQVKATDTDVETSSYSTPARFWVVPAGDSGSVRPVPGETIDGATLGCGTHRVQVFRRGGTRYVGEITNLSHVDWGRVRDDISTAQIKVSGWDVDCGNLLSKLQTWAYEVVIWRDNGYSEDRVWEGPITLLTYEQDMVTIDAKDVMNYAYRRIIKQTMNDIGSGNGTTVVDRARRVIQNVFAPDDPNILAYLQVLARDDDAMQYRTLPAYSRTAFEEVDDMAANAGLDYTCVGDRKSVV